jgi:hypothetical protein
MTMNRGFAGSEAMRGMRPQNPDLPPELLALLELLGSLGAGPAADAMGSRATPPSGDFLQSLIQQLLREGRTPASTPGFAGERAPAMGDRGRMIQDLLLE